MKLLISCAAFLLITPVFARTSSQSDVRSARQTYASIPAPSIDALLGTELLAYVLDEDNDPQSSLTLVQSVIATFFDNDGQDEPIAGQVPSLTSLNNFINFCATRPDLQITNGRQILTGSCNPTPMGVIASTANMPSTKFIFPQTSTTVTANADFTIQLAVNNLETGHITNVRET
ncbi:hypothetical protein TRAPUB_3267 [Trametes pubescens]|uniref:Uncharacterized protein n=1 Tax=Trametes pubescens TaxID=154538 RepID=A0A1M2VEF0_TRAPU|nr:hypothetical protein TRAPUB_3267 [Trametes pubescens]